MTQPLGPTVKTYYDHAIGVLVEIGDKMGCDLSAADQQTQILGKAHAAMLATLVYTIGRVVPTLPAQYAADLDAAMEYAWPRSDGTPPAG